MLVVQVAEQALEQLGFLDGPQRQPERPIRLVDTPDELNVLPRHRRTTVSPGLYSAVLPGR